MNRRLQNTAILPRPARAGSLRRAVSYGLVALAVATGCGSTVTPLDAATAPDAGRDDDADGGNPLTSVVELAAGAYHTCARRVSGAVVCWGLLDFGMFGDTPIAQSTPVGVPGLTDAVELAAGEDHTCARRASGAVVCWGGSHDGLLGDGTTTTFVRTIPVGVVGLTDAVEITAGVAHTCARRATGAVVCWGYNHDGQLGDGTTTDRLTPVGVAGLTDVVEIAAGGGHTCARRATGAVACWGDNGSGRLGDATTTGRLTPVGVAGLTDAVEITAGRHHTCARRASGAVACWGDNAIGQLGDGTTTDRLTPTTTIGL